MKPKKPIQFVFAALSLAAMGPSVLAFQGSATQEKPKTADAEMTVEQIVNKSVEAGGGKEAYEKFKTRVSKGTLEIKPMGLKGKFESLEKAPNKKLEVTDLENYGESIQGFDGKIGWGKDAMQGLRALEGAQLEFMKRDAVFNWPLHWKEIYKEAKNNGKKKVEDQDVYEVEFIPATGKSMTIYFDTKSFLPVMGKMVIESEQGEVPAKMHMADYREVDGVKFPFTMRQLAGPVEILVKIESIKHNVEIEDKKFTMPSEDEPKKEEKKEEPKKP